MTAEAASLKTQIKQLRKEVEKEYRDLISRYEAKMAEYDEYRIEVVGHYTEFQKTIQYLRDEIEQNQKSYDESKKNLKFIYDSVMNDKLNEQQEAFERAMAHKDQERVQLERTMEER